MTGTKCVIVIVALAAAIAGCAAHTSADSDSDDGIARYRPKAAPAVITIPAGTRLRIAMIDGVSSAKSSPGDSFMASLVEPVVVDGRTVLDKGIRLRGRVVDANESGRVKGRASLNLVLTDIVRNGKNMSIETRPFIAVAQSTKKRDAAVIGGGAGVGAAIGAIACGGKGAGVGALIGGGAGTGAVLATRGKELHYPPETRLSFTLSSPVQI